MTRAVASIFWYCMFFASPPLILAATWYFDVDWVMALLIVPFALVLAG